MKQIVEAQQTRIQKLENTVSEMLDEIKSLKAERRMLSPTLLPIESPTILPATHSQNIQPLTSTPVRPLPRPPSTSGQSAELRPPEEVVQKYKNLCKISHAGSLTCKLAKEAFLGEDVL